MSRKLKGRANALAERTYETAVLIARLKLRGLSTREIMAETNFAKSTVNNRLRVFSKLSDQLLREFEAGRLTTMEAERLAKFEDPAKQWAEFERGHLRPLRLRSASVRQVLEACLASSRSEEWKRGAADALRCILGETSIDDLGPPRR